MKVTYKNAENQKVLAVFTVNDSGICNLEIARIVGESRPYEHYSVEQARSELVELDLYPKALCKHYIFNVMAPDGITHLGSMCSDYPLDTLDHDAHEMCKEDAETYHGRGAIMTDFKVLK